jgi:predicted PurR-regulated permease PerM
MFMQAGSLRQESKHNEGCTGVTTEYLLAVILIVVAAAICAGGFVAVYWAMTQNSKLIKKQSAIMSDAKRKVQSDLHRKATDKFEKAVEENAEFLKKDIQTTSKELNTYVRTEFDGALSSELKSFRESASEIGKVSSQALADLQSSIAKEQSAVLASFKKEQDLILDDLRGQHQALAEKVNQMVEEETQRRITRFEGEMSRIVGNYARQAFANRIDIDVQLAYILEELEQNKQAIVGDLRNAA